MIISYSVTCLQKNADIIKACLDNIPDTQASWKPDEKEWSLVEVINHLYDEEVLDFRAHFQQALAGYQWSPIDPVSWALQHGYTQRKLANSLENFLNERQHSIAWLKTLQNPEFEKTIKTGWGEISAGNLFHSWIAHDYLHIRQINQLLYQYTAFTAQPYEVFYAGDW
jgi:hypothetical protein